MTGIKNAGMLLSPSLLLVETCVVGYASTSSVHHRKIGAIATSSFPMQDNVLTNVRFLTDATRKIFESPCFRFVPFMTK